MEFKHTSVLLEETIEYLNIRPDGIYVDGTLGGGGHAFQVCRKLGERGRFIGIDQDEDAIEAAGKRLAPFGDKVTILRSNYEQMREALRRQEVESVDGIVLDLGVSSYQLDDPERGFTYRTPEAPLDMRMDRRQAMTARDVVNEYSEMELFSIIRDYGEEAHRDHRGTDPGDKSGYSGQSQNEWRTSCQTDISGDTDRIEPGTGGIEEFFG